MKWRGKSNRLGRSVDLGLLPRIPKGFQVLVARMGDLVLWSFTTMEEREWKPQQPPEVEDDYLYPSQESSRWGRLTPESLDFEVRRLRCHLESLAPWCKDLGVSGVLFQRLRGGNRGLHHSGENLVWEAGFFGRSLRSRVKVSGLCRPESPALRPGVSTQKIPNSRISAEFSQPYHNRV
jgi:hypothetical protein